MRKMLRFPAMGSKLIFILLGLAITVHCNDGGSFSKHKILEVERKLKHLRRHSLKTIKSEDGDIIDCIDIKKQPAFDHPALKDHKIQMAPTYNSAKEEDTTEGSSTRTRSKTKSAKMVKQRDEEYSSVTVTSQVWQRSGRCPEGTIPVRRIRRRELLRAHSIDEYGRKKPSFSHRQVGQLNQNLDSFVQLQNHSKAIVFTDGYRYLGAKGDIKVCSPFVEKDDEYSTSQVALLNGAYNDFECVEAGWAVNPSVYGDRKTRLFVYWTADASKKTGCFDLTCPGFVQTSNEIALGAAIYPISIPGGLPYQITIYIYKDPITNNWWVQYGEKINIGYWPPELFKAICYNAESVEWGGEVYSTTVGHTPHTKTQMGNGQFPSVPGVGESSFILRMRIHDNSATLKIPEWVDDYSDEYYCYGVRYYADYVEDPEFYYGGPGRNPMCP